MSLEHTLARLLGDKTRIATCLFGEDDGGPLEDEAALFSSASETRIQSFRAGRTAARRALTKLGESPVAIGVGPAREPVFPARVRGSISHSKHLAIAVVAFEHDVRAIGIDLEKKRELAARVVERVTSPDERAGLSPTHQLVVFSAKESIYKALYPDVQRWFGFDAAKVSVVDNTRWTATLTSDLSPAWQSGQRVSGVWADVDGFVATACMICR